MPLPIEVISIPATIGSVRRPEVVAETPSTNCMYVGRNVSAPNIAKPTTNDSTQHTVNTGLREQPDRQDRLRRAAFDPHEHAQRRRGADEQPDDRRRTPWVVVPPQLVASVRPAAPRPTNSDAGIVDDRLRCVAASAGIAAAATKKTTTETGTLIQNAQRQVRWSVKKPPSSGPITVVTPNTAPRAPW